jgi:hypothetical protein
MVALKHAQMRTIDDAFDMHGGYVLDFSDRTMREFFDDEFSIDIYDTKYSINGSSKAKHVRAFVSVEDAPTVVRVMRALWTYRENCQNYQHRPASDSVKDKFFELLSYLDGQNHASRTDAIERFERSETLEELVSAIERDIVANKPVAALDRLHTYCAKKFGHLLTLRGITWDREEPLHSRVGKYFKALSQERELRPMTSQIIKNSIAVFDKFNQIRNNQSLAHDNELLDAAEARFIYDSVTAILRFLKSIESVRYGP